MMVSSASSYAPRPEHSARPSPEAQRELARRYQATGDRAALDALVRANLKLVMKIAWSYRQRRGDVGDLVACGNLGLVEACETYDPSRTMPFHTYAAYWIRAHILRHIMRDRTLVHVGTRAGRRFFWGLGRARRAIEARGDAITVEAIAAELGLPVEVVRELVDAYESDVVSLDQSPGSGRGTLGEMLTDPSELDPEASYAEREQREVRTAELHAFRDTLVGRERAVWEAQLRGEHLAAIGRQLGVSKERARQITLRLREQLGVFLAAHDQRLAG